MTEPCENCPVLPMCKNHLWYRVLQKCHLLSDYIIKKSSRDKKIAIVDIECPVHSLGRSYLVHYVHDTDKIFVSGSKDLKCSSSKMEKHVWVAMCATIVS